MEYMEVCCLGLKIDALNRGTVYYKVVLITKLYCTFIDCCLIILSVCCVYRGSRASLGSSDLPEYTPQTNRTIVTSRTTATVSKINLEVSVGL